MVIYVQQPYTTRFWTKKILLCFGLLSPYFLAKFLLLLPLPSPYCCSKRREHLCTWVRLQDPDGSGFMVSWVMACENLVHESVASLPLSPCAAALTCAGPNSGGPAPGGPTSWGGSTIGQVSSSPVGTPCLHTLSRECKSSCFGLGLRDWEKVLKLDCKSHAADYRFHFTLGVTFWAHINLGSMMDRMGNQPNVIKIPNSVP